MKSSPRATSISAYAAKCPPIGSKTGNPVLDDSNAAKRDCLVSIIDACLGDPELILPTYSNLQKRIHSRESEVQTSASKFATLSTLGRLDEDWCISWIMQHKQLSLNQLIVSKTCDDKSIYHIMSFALQYPLNLKIPADGQVKEVLRRMFDQRTKDIGEPLSKVSSQTFIGADGMIDWMQGAYQLHFSEGRLVEKITHRISGHTTTVDKGHHLNDDYTFHSNYDEWAACLRKPPMPDVHLHSFFKASAQGPYLRKRVTAGDKNFSLALGGVFAQWDEEQNSLMKSSVTTDVVDALCEVETTKRKKAMAQARATAERKLQATKRQRTMILKSGEAHEAEEGVEKPVSAHRRGAAPKPK